MPFVTAAAAPLVRDRGLSSAMVVTMVVDILKAAAADLGPPGHDPETGWGLVRRPQTCS